MRKRKLKNGQEVSGVNASTYEVLCCLICDGDLGHVDVDTLEDEGIAPPVARDIHALTENTEVHGDAEPTAVPKSLEAVT
jgi:hypothetical protein